MTFREYQIATGRTAIYPKEYGLGYVALGLAGEAGEVANKIKKVYRDSNGFVSFETRHALMGEIGDVLWYLSALATEIEAELSDIAVNNIQKLEARMKHGTIQGAGDSR